MITVDEGIWLWLFGLCWTTRVDILSLWWWVAAISGHYQEMEDETMMSTNWRSCQTCKQGSRTESVWIKSEHLTTALMSHDHITSISSIVISSSSPTTTQSSSASSYTRQGQDLHGSHLTMHQTIGLMDYGLGCVVLFIGEVHRCTKGYFGTPVHFTDE